MPEQVSVALGELVGEMREGLLALAAGTGLQVMAALMEADVTAACGPRGSGRPRSRAAAGPARPRRRVGHVGRTGGVVVDVTEPSPQGLAGLEPVPRIMGRGRGARSYRGKVDDSAEV